MKVQAGEKPEAAQDGAEGSKPNPQDGAEKAGGKEKHGGDVTVALKQERARRKQLEAELAARTNKGGGEKSKASEVQVPDLDISDDDIFGEPGKLKSKLQAFGADLVRKTREAVLAEVRAQDLQKEETGAVGKLLGKFEIFSDADQTLRADAQLAAIRALEESGPEDDAEKVIEGVAKRFSRYKADLGKAPQEQEPDTLDPLPPAGSGSEAAHLKNDPPRAKSFAEARKLSVAAALRFARRKQA